MTPLRIAIRTASVAVTVGGIVAAILGADIGVKIYERLALQSRAKDSVSEHLADPYSAQFEHLRNVHRAPETAVCGTVNAKNALGAYVGQHRFIFINTSGLMVEPAPDGDAGLFDVEWKLWCAATAS